MEKSLNKVIFKLSKEAAFILITLVSAVALPQLLHTVGIGLGIGGKLGQIFLPMYLPVMIIGFCRGTVSGTVVGVLAPIVSFLITGMPQEALLPYVAVELVATGLFAGLLNGTKMPVLLKVPTVQVIAKIIRLMTLALSLYLAGATVTAQGLLDGILVSIPGVLLQIVLVGLVFLKKEKNNG